MRFCVGTDIVELKTVGRFIGCVFWFYFCLPYLT